MEVYRGGFDIDLGQTSGCVSGELNRSLEPWRIKTKYKKES